MKTLNCNCNNNLRDFNPNDYTNSGQIRLPSITIESQVCLTPTNCIPVQTELPLWISLTLLGSIYLIAKEFLK